MVHNRFYVYMIACVPYMVLCSQPGQSEPVEQSSILQALERGLTFYASLRVAGGWPMAYSNDLKKRWGEWPECDERQITVQPPATPWSLEAYWLAFEKTGDGRWRSVALSAANVLVEGQCENGGWWYEIRFDPTLSQVDRSQATASFDDRVTQGTTQSMMRMGNRTGEERYRQSARKALDFMVSCRNAGRGWSQLVPADPNSYHIHDTLNDGATTDAIETLLMGWRTYQDKRYLEAAKAGGDWLITAQLPEPHRGWAQQYDIEGHAAPARWFEPAACDSSCTAQVIETLCDLYEITGDDSYLSPIPAALEWLANTQLKEGPEKGSWTRFREIGTNKPIFYSADKVLVYEPKNLRPGYAWFQTIPLDKLRNRYERLRQSGPPDEPTAGLLPDYPLSGSPERISHWVETQDKRGAWVGENDRIDSGTFCQAIFDLCAGL